MNSGSQKSRIWGEMTGRTWTDRNSFYSNWIITLASDYFNSLSFLADTQTTNSLALDVTSKGECPS